MWRYATKIFPKNVSQQNFRVAHLIFFGLYECLIEVDSKHDKSGHCGVSLSSVFSRYSLRSIIWSLSLP